MKKLDPDPDGSTPDFRRENLDTLKRLFPELVTEGKVDIDAFRALFSDEIEETPERYSFTWHGKSRARRIAQTPSTGTLLPCPEGSVNWDTTQNIFIEGDNLEVLKLLQKSYHRKVKMIYIDPPYNTGKEFIYPDKYQDNLDTYLRYTGQIDAEGFKLSANAETSGRYHTNWLNMMYPRLKLARNLLRDDGVIAISIDDHELCNLHKLCAEVFGEESLLATIANINNPKGRSDDAHVATAHEYILLVARDKDSVRLHGFEPDEKITRRYNRIDSEGRPYRQMDLRKTGDADRRRDRPAMFYHFFYESRSGQLRVTRDPDQRPGEEHIVPLREDGEEGRWRWGFDTALQKLDRLEARHMPNRGIWGVFEKDYLDGRSAVKPTSAWTFKDVNSERGSESFIDLGFQKEVFPRPKPVGTMERVLRIGTLPDEDSLVVDFFAGSCSLVQAIHRLVSDGDRALRYIVVQLPEPLDPNNSEHRPGYDFCVVQGTPPTIAEIGKERIRRSASTASGRQSSLGNDNKASRPSDLGFRIFKLASSNIGSWEGAFETVEESLLGSVDSIKPDRTADDVLYELLLKYGLDLAIPIESRDVAGKQVSIIGAGALVVCLATDVTLLTVEGIAALKDELNPEVMRVVFRDSGFADDVVKTNTVQILKQAGIDDVKSL